MTGDKLSARARAAHTRERSERGRVTRFAALCALYWAGAMVVVGRVPVIERVGVSTTTRAVLSMLNQFGQHAVSSASVVAVRGASVTIAPDCSPHVVYLVFASVVLAFPANWSEKALGLVAGLVAIFAFNVLRIVALVEVLAFQAGWFDFAHVFLWQTGTILMMVGAFGLWLRWLGRAKPGLPPAPVSAVTSARR